MADGDRSVYVTRWEFYGAQAILWAYMAIVLGHLLEMQWRWTTAVLCGASLLIALILVVASNRGRRGGGRRPAAPLSERVKELARDPGRKIEAIKAYREETGAGLAEAKEAVEAYLGTL
jgi:hypothetical protein